MYVHMYAQPQELPLLILPQKIQENLHLSPTCARFHGESMTTSVRDAQIDLSVTGENVIWGELWNPPAPKVLGRDRPDGTRKRLQVYLGGGAFFGQNLLFLIGRDARLQKTL